jgi:hypothetical protein
VRALLAGRVEGTLGSAKTVLGGIERALGLLHRGQRIGERILGCGLPAPQVGQLPHRLAAFPRLGHHATIIASSESPEIPGHAGPSLRQAAIGHGLGRLRLPCW